MLDYRFKGNCRADQTGIRRNSRGGLANVSRYAISTPVYPCPSGIGYRRSATGPPGVFQITMN